MIFFAYVSLSMSDTSTVNEIDDRPRLTNSPSTHSDSAFFCC